MIVFLIVIMGFFSWYSRRFFEVFVFEPRKDHFFTRKGVIVPSYTLIPYKNIQDIHLEQTVFDRIFGLWSVQIFSATYDPRGSDMIFGLNKENAENLKTEIFSKVKEVKEVVD
ncbi:MAG: PH domain-containing protein [Candidatus Altiarchaeota archaeon]